MHPDNLVALVRDPDAIARGLIALRRLLPGADVSAMACTAPQLLLGTTTDQLEKVRPSSSCKFHMQPHVKTD